MFVVKGHYANIGVAVGTEAAGKAPGVEQHCLLYLD